MWKGGDGNGEIMPSFRVGHCGSLCTDGVKRDLMVGQRWWMNFRLVLEVPVGNF